MAIDPIKEKEFLIGLLIEGNVMEYDTFLLYYICWHEGEFSISEMRQLLIDEIGKDGLTTAIIEFKKERLKMKENHITYYDLLKDESELDT